MSPLWYRGGTHWLTGEGVGGVPIRGDRHCGTLGIYHVTSFTSPIGGPNISVRLAYFHPNRLLTELYKQEMEILRRKDDGNIKKQTNINRHGPEPSLNSSQPPNPSHFSLSTTFFKAHLHFHANECIIPLGKRYEH